MFTGYGPVTSPPVAKEKGRDEIRQSNSYYGHGTMQCRCLL